MKSAKYLVFGLLTLNFSTFASATEVSLKTNEIETLLNSNTAHGVHFKARTSQYFSKSGLTIWIKEGDATPSEGRWEAKNDKYCSDFGSGEKCFRVAEDQGQGIYYFLSDGFRAPFIVREGYQPNN